MARDLNWIQVGQLAKGFGNGNALPDRNELAAKSIRIFFENGTTTRIHFNDEHSLRWEVLEGSGKGGSGVESYKATSLRQDIYFVDYIKIGGEACAISLVIDLGTGAATAVTGTLPTETETRKDLYRRAREGRELASVDVQFLSGTIDAKFVADQRMHCPTADLVGKRVKYTYSATETYEHIYLNKNLYTWHCLAGSEKGLADTDRCHHIKIADSLYLFTWWEKIIPTLGVVMIDLKNMKTTGKLFGYENNRFDKLINAPIGAYAALLNTTTYE